MTDTFDRSASTAACVLAAVAVALGAWSAHGLGEVLAETYAGQSREALGISTPDAVKYLGDFKTGVTYQMWAALAVLATAGWPGRAAGIGRWLVIAGAIVFSGSLYVLVLSGVRWWGAVTPIGGVLQLAGWATLVWAACRRGDAADSA